MSELILKATARTTDFGSAGSRRLVRAGLIPAVIYGHIEPEHIIINSRDFAKAVTKITESTLVIIDVDGKKHEALLKDFQEDLMTDTVRHIDFFAIERGQKLKAFVSIVVTGNPIGCKEGGVLDVVLHGIELECLPKDLPADIKVDVSNLKVNEHITVGDLNLGEGITIHHDLRDTVASVKTIKEEVVEVAEDANAAPEVIGAKPEDAAATDAE